MAIQGLGAALQAELARRAAQSVATAVRTTTNGGATPPVQAPTQVSWDDILASVTSQVQAPTPDNTFVSLLSDVSQGVASPEARAQFEAEQAQQSSGGGFSIGDLFDTDTFKDAIWKGIDYLDTPRAALVSTMQETADWIDGEGFSFEDWKQQTADNMGFGEYVENGFDIESIWARRLLGFTGDVLFDPMTYVGGKIITGGAEAVRYADEAFTVAARLQDLGASSRAVARIEEIGVKLAQRGGTALTSSDVAVLNAARGASGADDAARALGARLGGADEAVALVERAVSEGLDRSARRQIARVTDLDHAGGVRLAVPGTGRLARRVSGGRISEASIQILPQDLARFTPRGGVQALKGKAKTLDADSLVRRMFGGEFTQFKAMLGSKDPRVAAQGFHALKAVDQYRNASQALLHEGAVAMRKLQQTVGDDALNTVKRALQGEKDAVAELGEDGWRAAQEFREEMFTAVNKHVVPDEGLDVLSEDMRRILTAPLVGDLSSWSPLSFSEDAQKLIDTFQDVMPSGVNPRNAAARIKDGEMFMGKKLLRTDDPANPLNKTPVQQAEERFAEVLAERGIRNVDSLFEKDMVKAFHTHLLWQAENVGRERAIRELGKRGIARQLIPDAVDAVGRAETERGFRLLEGAKAEYAKTRKGKKGVAPSIDDLIKATERGAAPDPKQLKAAEKAAAAAEKKLADGIAQAEKALRNAQRQGADLDTVTRWRDTLEGVAAAAKVAHEDALAAAERFGLVSDAVAAGLNKQILEDLNVGIDMMVRDVQKMVRHNKAIYGEMGKVRRKLETAQLEAAQLRKRAAADVERAGSYGRRLAKIDGEIARASDELAKWEGGLSRLNGLAEQEAILTEGRAKVAKVRARRTIVGDALSRYRAARSGTRQEEILREAAASLGVQRVNEQSLVDEYKRLGKMVEQGEVMTRQIEERITAATGGRGAIETTRYYEGMVRSASDRLERVIEGRARILDELSQEPEDLQLLAAAQLPPRTLADGRLAGRNTEVWTPSAHSATNGRASQRTATRFYGEVLEEGTNPNAQRVDLGDSMRDPISGRTRDPKTGLPVRQSTYTVQSRNPMQYFEGEEALWMDGVDALLRRSDFTVPKSWGDDWKRVERNVKAGVPLRYAISNALGPNVNPIEVVTDLVQGTKMSRESKRLMARAHRDLAIAGGHDSITYLTRGGRWHVIPMERHQLDELAAGLDEDSLDAVITIQREMTDRLYENARVQDRLAEQLGADLEALNGRLFSDADIEQRMGRLKARKERLEDAWRNGDLLVKGSGPTLAARELGELRRVEYFRDEQAKIVARMQGQFDQATAELETSLLNVARLEEEAAIARASLLELKKTPMEMEDFINRMKSVRKESVDHALRAGFKQVGRHGELQVSDAIYEGLRGHSTLMDVDGLLKHIDTATRVWKAQAVLSPGFHVRNALGGMINNFSAGIEHGRYREISKANKVYERALKQGKSHTQALDIVERQLGDLGKRYRLVRDSGIMDGGQFDELAYIATADTSYVNPFRQGFVGFKYGRKKGAQVEGWLRGALALDVLAKGGNLDAAIAAVHKFHFDYEDLSKFERGFARRVIPFYTWSRKNLPLQLEMMAENPKTFTRYLAIQRNTETGTEEESVFFSHLDRAASIALPMKIGGDQVYLTPDTPFRDLTQMVSPQGILSSANPLFRAPVELATGRSFFTGQPFEDRYEKLPTTLGWMSQALEAVGLASRDQAGNIQVKASVAHAIRQVPLLANLERLDPVGAGAQLPGMLRGEPFESTGERPGNRIATSAVSWLFGIGARVNTDWDQSNELYRRAYDLDSQLKRLDELGFGDSAEAEQLRIEQQFLFDAAAGLREGEGLPPQLQPIAG